MLIKHEVNSLIINYFFCDFCDFCGAGVATVRPKTTACARPKQECESLSHRRRDSERVWTLLCLLLCKKSVNPPQSCTHSNRESERALFCCVFQAEIILLISKLPNLTLLPSPLSPQSPSLLASQNYTCRRSASPIMLRACVSPHYPASHSPCYFCTPQPGHGRLQACI